MVIFLWIWCYLLKSYFINSHLFGFYLLEDLSGDCKGQKDWSWAEYMPQFSFQGWQYGLASSCDWSGDSSTLNQNPQAFRTLLPWSPAKNRFHFSICFSHSPSFKNAPEVSTCCCGFCQWVLSSVTSERQSTKCWTIFCTEPQIVGLEWSTNRAACPAAVLLASGILNCPLRSLSHMPYFTMQRCN